MAILDIKMLSGFVPDPQSLQRVSSSIKSRFSIYLGWLLMLRWRFKRAEYHFTAQRCSASGSCWSERGSCCCLLRGGESNLHLEVINDAVKLWYRFQHVFFLLQQLPQNLDINHTLELIQELSVQNLKPAVVKIYDYYQPSNTDTFILPPIHYCNKEHWQKDLDCLDWIW